jgi:hypothetical protein
MAWLPAASRTVAPARPAIIRWAGGGIIPSSVATRALRAQTRTLAEALYGKAGMTEAEVADLNARVKALRDAFRAA